MSSLLFPLKGLGRAGWGGALLLVASACGSDDSGPAAAPPGSGGAVSSAGAAGSPAAGGQGGAPGAVPLSYAPCEPEDRVGGFSLQLIAESEAAPGYASVQGRIRDGVTPSDVWQEAMAEGDCSLLVGRNLSCTPACGSDQTCGDGDTCIAAPRARDVGSISFSGLSVELTLTPNSSNFYDSSSAGLLPLPPFETDASLLLAASGGDYAPFELRGQAIEQLELGTQAISVERDQPVSLTWSTAAELEAARIHVVLDIARHGGIAARLECDFADTGSATIPGALVSALMDRGVAGYPTIVIARRTVDSAVIDPGCVELEIASPVDREVTIPGLVSCSIDENCTEPETCLPDLTCG